jgi:hypothetical protein
MAKPSYYGCSHPVWLAMGYDRLVTENGFLAI